MQDNNKLIKLIEQAVCSTNMLSTTDLSELDKLQTILDQISENIAEISDGPAQLLEQAKGTTSDAAEMLGKILNKQVKNTDKSIKSVQQAVSNLQSLIDQIAQEAPAASSQSSQKDLPTNYETDAQEDVVISEEDIPLILDFISESGEHLGSSEVALLEIETKPNDNELLNQIFRSFHSIKGLAGFLNLTDIGSLAHAAEKLEYIDPVPSRVRFTYESISLPANGADSALGVFRVATPDAPVDGVQSIRAGDSWVGVI